VRPGGDLGDGQAGAAGVSHGFGQRLAVADLDAEAETAGGTDERSGVTPGTVNVGLSNRNWPGFLAPVRWDQGSAKFQPMILFPQEKERLRKGLRPLSIGPCIRDLGTGRPREGQYTLDGAGLCLDTA
jgi:hypothetical protein